MIGNDSLFTARPLLIKARQALTAETIKNAFGSEIAWPGQWIVTSPNGDRYVLSDVIFRESYTPVGQAGQAELDARAS